MSAYKEFTGKTLDEAIKEACAFFNVEREKLEIEILNDAKTGIFGLVGAKKATVRARKVSLDDIGLTFPSKEEKTRERGGKKTGRAREERAAPAAAQAVEEAGGAPASNPPKSGKRPQPAKEPQGESAREAKKQPPAGSLASRRAADPSFAPEVGAAEETETSLAIRPQTLPAVAESTEAEAAEPRSRSKSRGRGKGREQGAGEAEQARPQRDKKKNQQHGGARNSGGGSGRQRNGGSDSRQGSEAEPGLPFAEDDNGFEDQLPVIPLEELDQELLRQTVLETLGHLVTPLAGETASSLSIDDSRVRVRLETVENQGLIIGRDGQTLSSLQYLLSCITSRRLGASVRVQIDAGDYREKQEEKLRALALNLAQKVKNTQRPQSTRPLSAYHRRIIHLTLQDDPDVQTHSKSEGNLKSVVIVPRRKNAK